MVSPSVPESSLTVYAPLYDEHDYVIDDYEGTLPAELRGTLYRNGPGKLDAGGHPLGHLFDGDGMLSMFAFSDGAVHYRNRYIQTEHYRKSLESKEIPFRTLGTMRPGGLLANALRFPANVANTGVVMHAGKLLALWEGGPPTEIDPDTLDTIGIDRFGGKLRWLGAFSAHPKWDRATGDMFNFGLAMFPIPKLICYRVDRAGKLHRLGHLTLPGPMFNHDVGLTARNMVFVVPPLIFPIDMFIGAGLGVRNFIDAIQYDAKRGTMIGLMPRSGGKPLVLHTDPTLHLHLVNAYEDRTDTVVEMVNYHASWEQLNGQLSAVQSLDQMGSVPYGGHLLRMRITRSGKVTQERFSDTTGEFPAFNLSRTGQRSRYTHLATGLDASVLPNAIAKVDNVSGAAVTYRLPPGHLPQEGVFAARPGGTDEDDGWLLVPAQDGINNAANLLVLDARKLDAGPVYTGRLRHHLPLSFHGCFTPRVARPV